MLGKHFVLLLYSELFKDEEACLCLHFIQKYMFLVQILVLKLLGIFIFNSSTSFLQFCNTANYLFYQQIRNYNCFCFVSTVLIFLILIRTLTAYLSQQSAKSLADLLRGELTLIRRTISPLLAYILYSNLILSVVSYSVIHYAQYEILISIFSRFLCFVQEKHIRVSSHSCQDFNNNSIRSQKNIVEGKKYVQTIF